jgi:hypothetical protein
MQKENRALFVVFALFFLFYAVTIFVNLKAYYKSNLLVFASTFLQMFLLTLVAACEDSKETAKNYFWMADALLILGSLCALFNDVVYLFHIQDPSAYTDTARFAGF